VIVADRPARHDAAIASIFWPMRRIASLVTALLTLHLTLVGGDLACARHSAGSAVAESHAMPMASHHEMSTSGAGVSEPGETCPTPSTPVCCRAMTSCGQPMNAARTFGGELSSNSNEHGRRPVLPPLSRSTAPEPPPPRV
jgi:hypothetical protein